MLHSFARHLILTKYRAEARSKNISYAILVNVEEVVEQCVLFVRWKPSQNISFFKIL